MTTETKAAFARRCRANKSTITRWAQAGRLVMSADGRVEVEASLASIRDTMAHRDDVAARHAFSRGSAIPVPHPTENNAPAAPYAPMVAATQPQRSQEPEAEEVARRIRLATMREQEAKAEARAMEVDKQAGLLVERADVEFVLRDFGHTLRGLVESLPDRLSPEIAAKAGNVNAIHTLLEQAGQHLLAEVSEHMARRQAEMAAQ